MCLGVTTGAYILTIFAMKYREHVIGLVLVSPLCRAPSWSEWFYNKEVHGGPQVPESDIVQACRSLLDERKSTNVLRLIEMINGVLGGIFLVCGLYSVLWGKRQKKGC